MCKTIKHKVKFRASPDQVYRFLTDNKKHTLMTGEKAEISQKVGGKFSVRAGFVNGINVDMVPGKHLVQAWRNKNFPEGIFSMAAFQLTKTAHGGTELVLTHRGVPKQLIPDVERDWREIYWEGIRASS